MPKPLLQNLFVETTVKENPSTEPASVAPITEQVTSTTTVEVPTVAISQELQKENMPPVTELSTKEIDSNAADQTTTGNAEAETAIADQNIPSVGVEEELIATDASLTEELEKAIEEEMREIDASEENLDVDMAGENEEEGARNEVEVQEDMSAKDSTTVLSVKKNYP